MATTTVNVQGADEVRRRFVGFLNEYSLDLRAEDEDLGSPGFAARARELVYVQQLRHISSDSTTLTVDFGHLVEYDTDLAHEGIQTSFYKYQPFLHQAAAQFVRQHRPEMARHVGGVEKEWWVKFVNLPQVQRLRTLKANNIGQLASFSGTVTRTSDVRPELLLGCFRCGDCNELVPNVEQQCRYTTPAICLNETCGNRTKWTLEKEGCKFVDWQRVRVQENADEVPAGSLPRSMDVILRHEIVEEARAGDKAIFTGTLLVVPEVAPKNMAGDRTSLVRRPKVAVMALLVCDSWALASSSTAWCLSRKALLIPRNLLVEAEPWISVATVKKQSWHRFRRKNDAKLRRWRKTHIYTTNLCALSHLQFTDTPTSSAQLRSCFSVVYTRKPKIRQA